MIKAALYYREKLNLSIIPIIPGNKKALIPWSDYQAKLPTVEEINAWWKKTPNANIGIITGKINNIVIVDLDKYKSEYSEEAVLEYFPESLETPTVISPRGGNHLYFKYPDQKMSNDAGAIPGVDFRATGGYIVAPPSVNGNKKKYAWIKGLGIEDVSLAELPEKYINLLDKKNTYVFKRRNTKCKSYAKNTHLFQQGRRDQDLFHLANSLIKGRMPEEEIYQYLEYIAKTCNPPYPEKDIGIKIKSALQRIEKTKDKSFYDVVKDWVCNNSVTISQQSGYNALQCVTRNEKAKLRVYLNRLEKEGFIKKTDTGKYRKVDTDVEWLDILNADRTPFGIKWPFEIEKLVKMPPGTIALVAGQQEAGKTSFLLNLAKMNMNKGKKIIYLSSETNAQGLGIRCSGFQEDGVSLEELNNGIQFGYKPDNMVDALDPDGINILDYLEILKDFWEVGSLVAEIFKKMNTGVAIIGLQMHGDKPLGGQFGLHKPEIALKIMSEESGARVIIEKARWWTQPRVCPKHLSLLFKIRHGCLLRQLSEWEKYDISRV